MKKPLITGLAVILLAGISIMNVNAQKREYASGNVNSIENSIEYADTTKKTNYMKYREEMEKRLYNIGNEDTTKQKKETNVQKEIQSKQIPYDTTNATEKKDSAVYHIIRKGDTFYSLADKYLRSGKEANEIEKLNPGVDPSKLKIGQKIRVK